MRLLSRIEHLIKGIRKKKSITPNNKTSKQTGPTKTGIDFQNVTGNSQNPNLVTKKLVGVVERYFPTRGYGFLHSPTGRLFVHVSEVIEGKPLKVGDVVQFQPGVTEKGPRAFCVRKIKSNKNPMENQPLSLENNV